MKLSWRDALSSVLAIFGGVVTFAKLQSYSWPLLGSWKGALGVIGIVGLAILLVYAVEIVESTSLGVLGMTLAWIAAATIIAAGIFSTTTKAEFVWSGILIGLSWLSELASHAWGSMHHGSSSHYAAAH